MDAHWHNTFRLWSQTDDYRQSLQRAEAVIADALARARKPFVSFSGGKDSTVLTHLVLQHQPDMMVLHWDYGRAFVPYTVHKRILEIADAIGVRNLRIETSPLYRIEGRAAKNVMGRHLIGQLLPRLADEGYDLDFVGLREEESLKRRRRIRAQRMVSRIPEAWPLASWRWLDVWAYVVSNDLPYLWLYDQRARVEGYQFARFTTLFDGEFSHIGADTTDNVLHWRWRNLK